MRWAEVASANNRVMHPVAEWGSLTGSWQLKRQDCVWDHGPREGQLPQRVGERLAEALAPFTDRANRCYFGVWEGWGDPSFMFFFTEGTPEEEQRRVREEAEAGAAAWRGLLDHAPKFTLPDRPMHLLEAPLDSIREFYEQHRKPPSIWWPEDRTWCVATDIDLMSTYLGGNASAIQPLLGDERIEALPVPVDQRVDWEADSINPLPEPPYK